MHSLFPPQPQPLDIAVHHTITNIQDIQVILTTALIIRPGPTHPPGPILTGHTTHESQKSLLSLTPLDIPGPPIANPLTANLAPGIAMATLNAVRRPGKRSNILTLVRAQEKALGLVLDMLSTMCRR
jgi:hypothetical protein